ncbi:MAG: SH3 domain-containing protein, partial [Patescibacteria group bacterium]
SGIRVTASPQAKVFIDGEQKGETTLEIDTLKPGEYLLKTVSLENEKASWAGKVRLTTGTMTIVNRELNSDETLSSGETIYLEKINGDKAEITITGNTDGISSELDNSDQAIVPNVFKNISPGEHEIKLSKDGYATKKISTKTLAGYRSVIHAQIAQGGNPSLTASPSGTLTPASPSGGPAEEMEKPYIIVKNTPTGWLRVRSSPSLSATESAKINPGEKYSLLEENDGWIKIKLNDGSFGYVSISYVSIIK